MEGAKVSIPTTNVLTPPSAPAKKPPLLTEGFAEVARLEALVDSVNACALPGVSIEYDKFIPYMWYAVSKGFVTQANATFVENGLRHGFTLGIDTTSLRGRRVFRNYTSALENRHQVTKAIGKRVATGKTLDLGQWSSNSTRAIPYDNYTIFPMGAVA